MNEQKRVIYVGGAGTAQGPTDRLLDLPSKPDRKDSINFVLMTGLLRFPDGSNELEWLRRNFHGIFDGFSGPAPDIFLSNHPLPIVSPGIVQQGAWTSLTGSAAMNASLIECPEGQSQVKVRSWVPTGPHRPVDRNQALDWKVCGCLDIAEAPYELLFEVLHILNIGLTGLIEVDRTKINRVLHEEQGAARALFEAFAWTRLIRHKIRLDKSDRWWRAATISAALASKMYSEVPYAEVQLPFSRSTMLPHGA